MPLKSKKNKKAIVCRTLANGVHVITEPIASSHTAAIGFWFSCGSRSETAEYRGAAHFCEHMLFKGSRTRSAFDIALSFDRMGSNANAFTEHEHVCLHCSVPAFQAENALELLCDMCENSLFESAELEKERSVIQSEIKASADDPEEAALDAVAAVVWQNNSLAAPIAGSVSDVKKLTREALYEWYESFFKKGSLTVCAAGNIDPDIFYSRLKKLGIRKKTVLPFSYTVPEWKSGMRFLRSVFQQEQIFVLYPLPYPLNITDFYCLTVLNALIGDTMSSRLFQSLREKGGYCYSVYSFFSLYTDCGCWCAYASSPKKNAVRAVEIIKRELDLLLTGGLSDDEITAAKEHVCGEEIINAEDTEQRMKRLARSAFAGFEQHTSEQAVHAVRALTKEQLLLFLQRLLRKADEAVIVYGPAFAERSQKKLKSLLKRQNAKTVL